MSLPPRQPRPLAAAGAPRNPAARPTPPNMSFEQRVQHALDMSRANIPDIPDPGYYANVPVVGSAWQAAADLQDGDYAGAAFNTAMLAAEISPFAPIARVVKLTRAVNKMRKARLLASSSTQLSRIRKIEQKARNLAGNTEEFVIHHVYPMKGAAPTSREARRIEGLWRNHPANMKILPKHIHEGVHNGFGNPVTDPVLKLWHGTNDLHKTSAAFTGAAAADVAQNVSQPRRTPQR
ncbi:MULTISPECIES: hypothetical protein [unclassified Sphingomonas]|nr:MULTISPECIES: hypothetical protein [unclassified Sphingomonas]